MTNLVRNICIIAVIVLMFAGVICSFANAKHKYSNREITAQFTGKEKGFPKTDQGAIRIPTESVKAEKHDLNAISQEEDILVWMGHSSIFLQVNGKRFLVDPVLCSTFPSNLMMKAFPGSDIWTPEDIPQIDFLIITHDHWDHLDKKTLRKIRSKVGAVYCGLDVGRYIKSCGYSKDQIHERNWDESAEIAEGMTLHCLTSRHFSGRLLRRNPTLWTSWLIEADKKIYISGDGGYGKHFKQIGERFSGVDLAIMENGQYSPNWKHIHMMPNELPQAIIDLKAKAVFTCHHGKFALSHHDYLEPEQKIREASKAADWKLLDTNIGSIVRF